MIPPAPAARRNVAIYPIRDVAQNDTIILRTPHGPIEIYAARIADGTACLIITAPDTTTIEKTTHHATIQPDQ